MKQTIRPGIFETNSSSTHAIVVPHDVTEKNYSIYDSLRHDYGFGREECRLVDDWDEKLAYVYLILKDYESYNENRIHKITLKDIEEFKQTVNDIFNDFFKKEDNCCYYVKPDEVFKFVDKDGNDKGSPLHTYSIGFNAGCFVDHVEDFDENGFLDLVLNDKEFLKRFLFNRDSYITVGGDEYRGYNIKTIGFEYDYDEDYENTEFWNKIEEYEKDKDVFFKGN